MTTHGRTDALADKPRYDMTRQARVANNTITLITANNTTSGNVIVFQGANSVNFSGINVGSYVYGANVNLSQWGVKDFFGSNNTVNVIPTGGNGNTIWLSSAVSGNVPIGTAVDIAVPINYGTDAKANTYFADTILVTDVRANTANANTVQANVGNFTTGWVHIQKKTNSDGTVRFLKETLVCLTNASSSNTTSGNTSFGQVVKG